MLKSQLNQQIKNGKIILVSLIAISIVNIIYRLIRSIILQDTGRITEVVITSFIVLALYRLLYLGYVWAKWFMVVTLGISGIFSFYFLFFIILKDPTFLDLTLYEILHTPLIGTFFIIFSAILIFSKNVNLFLDRQNKKRKSNLHSK